MSNAQDKKIERLVANIEEDIESLTKMKNEKPETHLSDVEVRAWLLAIRINFDTLKAELKDLQPSLFIV